MKRIYIVLIMLIFILIMSSLINFYTVYADQFKINSYESASDQYGLEGYAKDATGVGVKVAASIAGGCVAIAILLIATKYITSAPDGKADVKRYAIPFVIGCAIVFGVQGILNALLTISRSIG